MYVLPHHGVSHKSELGNEKTYPVRVSTNELYLLLFKLDDLLEVRNHSSIPILSTQRLPSHTCFLSPSILSETQDRWAFQSMEDQVYFKTVTTLTVKLSKHKVQIFSSASVLIMQSQRALSSVDLLFIIPFYLKLSKIFLHSESDSPRCPRDKWEYYCLQAVHDATGAGKKMHVPSKVLIILG